MMSSEYHWAYTRTNLDLMLGKWFPGLWDHFNHVKYSNLSKKVQASMWRGVELVGVTSHPSLALYGLPTDSGGSHDDELLAAGHGLLTP